MPRLSRITLQRTHTPEEISKRLKLGPQQTYLKDMVFGAIDGSITTFAIVSGVAGAGLSSGVVIVLGLANLLADGFSMAASNFLGTRADNAYRQAMKLREQDEIEAYPEGEVEEIRQIFSSKGLTGKTLDDVVNTITSDPTLWVETMLHEEHGFSREPINPWSAALATFIAFLVAGFLPLATFVMNWRFPGQVEAPFIWSAVLTLMCFGLVGAVKGLFTGSGYLLSVLETLLVGSVAAVLAYGVGYGLQSLVSGVY